MKCIRWVFRFGAVITLENRRMHRYLTDIMQKHLLPLPPYFSIVRGEFCNSRLSTSLKSSVLLHFLQINWRKMTVSEDRKGRALSMLTALHGNMAGLRSDSRQAIRTSCINQTDEPAPAALPVTELIWCCG
jgi:hypothetical protein